MLENCVSYMRQFLLTSCIHYLILCNLLELSLAARDCCFVPDLLYSIKSAFDQNVISTYDLYSGFSTAATCRHGGDVVARHNRLRDIFANFCRRAHLSVQVEVGYPSEKILCTILTKIMPKIKMARLLRPNSWYLDSRSCLMILPPCPKILATILPSCV